MITIVKEQINLYVMTKRALLLQFQINQPSTKQVFYVALNKLNISYKIDRKKYINSYCLYVISMRPKY